MSDKTCSYCDNEVEYAPLEEMSRHGVGVYFCHKCRAEYLFYEDGTMASVSLYTEINGKTYRWSIIQSTGDGILWYVKEPGIPGKKKNEGMETLKSFYSDDKPEITPQNFQTKLRVWLPFL